MSSIVAAVDVGGTSMKGALVDGRSRIVHEARRVTPREDGPDAVIDAIAGLLGELVADAAARGTRAVAAGVVVPGIVDEAAGWTRFSANLGWRELPLAAMLAERAGVPVALGHDVRAGGLAELRLGAGTGVRGMLFLPLGYGIAGAIVADGRPVSAGGFAGELGHLCVEPDGAVCGCGARGCLETVASGSAIGRRYAVRAGVAAASAREVADLVAAGDPLAIAVWDEAVAALASVIATAATILAPERVVIGGGVSLAGDRLFVPLRAAVPPRMTPFLRVPDIVPARLGDRAGCLGAAIMAQEFVSPEASSTSHAGSARPAPSGGS
ncbi:MAG: ROK family protein [Chloroflexota bacterium]